MYMCACVRGCVRVSEGPRSGQKEALDPRS